MRKLLLLVVVILLLFTLYKVNHPHAGTSKAGGRPGAIDSAAPGFSLHDLDGRPLELSTYRGKVVLLDFWATWCVPCKDEIPHFVKFQDAYRDQGLQVIGVSMDDSPKPVQQFYRDFKMNYPVAMGSTALADSYGGILGLPVTFLIGRDGRIAAKYVGATDMSAFESKLQSVLQAK